MSGTSPTQPRCVVCEQTSEAVPLLTIQFRNSETWICTQHLPMLIHNPAQLAQKLPGAEQLSAPEGHDH